MAIAQTVDQIADVLASILEFPRADTRRIIQRHVNQVPYQDREDLLQSLALKLLEAHKLHQERLNLEYTYSICRNYVVDWWRDRSGKKRDNTLLGEFRDWDEPGQPADNERELIEATTGIVQYEILEVLDSIPVSDNKLQEVESRLDAEALYSRLPAQIQKLTLKRMSGQGLRSAERMALSRYLHDNPMILALR